MLTKFIACSFSAVSVVSSKPCVGPLPRIRISFYLLPIYADELISAPNIITFLLNPLPLDNEKLPCTSNPMPYSEYLCLLKSAFLVNSIQDGLFPGCSRMWLTDVDPLGAVITYL